VEGWDFTFRRRPQARFRPRSSIRRKTCTLIVLLSPLSYLRPSHTDGDIAAYFVEADVLHTRRHLVERYLPRSSIFHRRPYQGHDQGGGDEPGQSHEKTIVIPGHGRSAGIKDDRLPRHADNHSRSGRCAEEKRQSLEEIVATKPTAAYDSKWATSFITGDALQTSLHRSLRPAPLRFAA